MTVTHPPELIAELGRLAAKIAEAEYWALLPVPLSESVSSPVVGSLPPGFPLPALHPWLADLCALTEAPSDFPPLPISLGETWQIAAFPLASAADPSPLFLCLFSPNEECLSGPTGKALHLVIERFAKAAASLIGAKGAPLPSLENLRSPEAGVHYARMERFEGAMLSLVKAGHDDLASTLRLVTEVAAEALEVELVEIWLHDQERSELHPYQAFPHEEVPRDLILDAVHCPRFFAGLDAQLVMAISSARDDPRLQEILSQMGLPIEGGALIVPIWLQGGAAGILAHFHRGAPREWSRDEQDFSGAVAGIVALALEADAHRRTEAQLHALAAHLDAVREEERAGLARELHDELGQMLTALRMDAAWLGKACTSQPEKLAARGPERVAAMKQLLDDAVATVQRISSDLRPGPLHELGLVAALEYQLTEFRKRSGILTSLTVPEGELAIGERPAIVLYRALQEALTNIARHAGATEVHAALRTGVQRIYLEIRDNGRGMPEHALRAATSLGLIGMRERAATLGGEVLFRSARGQGTAVLVSLPLPATPASTPVP